MKAVVIHRYGGPGELKWEDFADPEVKPGEVLVHTAAASVNPVDWKIRSGEAKARFPMEFPGILGRDLSGLVRQVGQDVEGWAEGDRVMALTERTYAELVSVPAAELVRVPDDLGIVEAAALPLVLLTGEQAVSRAAEVKSGETVLVAGALGSVGRVAVFVAKQLGATVIAGVRKRQKDEAKALGVAEVVALDDEAEMRRLGLVDRVVDLVGGHVAEMLLSKVKQGGVMGTVLGPPANAGQHPTVEVRPMMAKPDGATMARLAEEVAGGRLVIPIDRILPLREAGEAQRAAEKGGIGKVVLAAS